MTGKKNRYATQEKLLKIDDDSLKTPEHDELVLWLLDQRNSVSIIPEIKEYCKIYYQKLSTSYIINYFAEKGYQISPDCIEILMQWCVPDKWNQLIRYLETHCPNVIVISKDLIELSRIKSDNYLIDTKTEVPIWNGKFIIGYWDVVINFTGYGRSPPPVYIEVKPHIKSFGETLRQLNTYRAYIKDANIYLFTKDTRFEDAFKSQGIKVIHPIETLPNIAR